MCLFPVILHSETRSSAMFSVDYSPLNKKPLSARASWKIYDIEKGKMTLGN